MASKSGQVARINGLLTAWKAYRAALPEPARYCQLKEDLYKVRNAGWNGNPPLAAWPANLVDPDDSVMAAVEHYFLCRCWVGTGQYPAWQMRAMNGIYDAGKMLGASPRHNPTKPTTPITSTQMAFQEAGVRDGEADLRKSGKTAPLVAKPPTYW
ncbi:MAG: hypothetical protein IT503_05690 [Burkholderiaceae bacterium]|nr:hypothetical protein [Ideonella sp.]MCC7285654.1 hypothetical protein [Burkholderiaceae bacterium]